MAGLWPRIRLPQRYSPRCPEHREQVFQAPAPPRRATRHTLARSPPHMRHLAPLSRHAPEVGPTPARPCLDTVDPRPLLALDTLDGSCNRRGDGRSFGLATAALPLPKPPDKRAGSFPFSRVLQEKKARRRADSNRLLLLITSDRSGVAGSIIQDVTLRQLRVHCRFRYIGDDGFRVKGGFEQL